MYRNLCILDTLCRYQFDQTPAFASRRYIGLLRKKYEPLRTNFASTLFHVRLSRNRINFDYVCFFFLEKKARLLYIKA